MTKGRNTGPLDAGVGTGDWFDWLGGGSSGVGVSRNIRNAYAFLVNNYQAAAPATPYQSIHQTWFCGVHTDVGGGYPENGTSAIPLLWMEGLVHELLDLHPVAIEKELDRSIPYGKSKMHDSFKEFIAFYGVYHRRVGLGFGQFVHRSVLDRIAAGDYYVNAAFAFDTLPVWEPTPFERQYAWSVAAPEPWLPALVGAPTGLCDSVVQFRGGG
jgi:hypothetical protein